MTTATSQDFAPTTVKQLKHETDVRQRIRVVFEHPRREQQRFFSFMESAVHQLLSHQLFVPVPDALIRLYQREHPSLPVLVQMQNLLADQDVILPLLPEHDPYDFLRPSGRVHSDNLGWRFGEAPEKSTLCLFDPTMPQAVLPEARVRWEQHPQLSTKVLVVETPKGLAERSLALVDEQLTAIRQRFVNDWLGGPAALRKLLGLTP
jgi:hypothetical protein